METLSFLTTAVRDRNVGAIVPTSTSGVKTTLRSVEWNRPAVFVEYGPGTGVFTRYLLKKLHRDSTLIAIELNKLFAERLRRFDAERKSHEPRLIVESGDARDVLAILGSHGFKQADYVVSGIPFSFLDEGTKAAIIESTHRSLAPGGTFLVYQYSFHVHKYLRAQFDAIEVRRTLMNLPPLCVMEARKNPVEYA